jgi:hypothetical protein
MSEIKYHMIEKARKKYCRIFPCAARATLDDCFTIENDRILFWFNTEDQSTRLLVAPAHVLKP